MTLDQFKKDVAYVLDVLDELKIEMINQFVIIVRFDNENNDDMLGQPRDHVSKEEFATVAKKAEELWNKSTECDYFINVNTSVKSIRFATGKYVRE